MHANPALPVKTLSVLYLSCFLTAAASFIYEIGWVRMLSLVLGSSTHAFEPMLSAFIFGLAIGGFWIRERKSTDSRTYDSVYNYSNSNGNSGNLDPFYLQQSVLLYERYNSGSWENL